MCKLSFLNANKPFFKLFFVLFFFAAQGVAWGQVDLARWNLTSNGGVSYSDGSVSVDNFAPASQSLVTYNSLGALITHWDNNVVHYRYVSISLSSSNGDPVEIANLIFEHEATTNPPTNYTIKYYIAPNNNAVDDYQFFTNLSTVLINNESISGNPVKNIPLNMTISGTQKLIIRFYTSANDYNNSGYRIKANTLKITGPAVDPPVSVNDNASTGQNIPVDIDILDNDTYSVLSGITITDQPDHGSNITVNGLTDVTYTPNNGYTGSDSFKYTITDENGTSGEATVSLNVVPVVAPTAVADAVSAIKNETKIINILANDNQGSGAFDEVTIVSQPTHGDVIVNPNNTVSYTPDTNYTGADSFQYEVTNIHNATSNTATVSINVLDPVGLVRWSSTDKSPTLIASHINSTSIGNGTGITVVHNNWGVEDQIFHCSGWSSGGIDLTKYVEFTISADSNYKIDLNNFSFYYKDQGGTSKFQVQYSKDDFVTSYTSISETNATTTWTSASANLSSVNPVMPNETVKIRIYVYNSSNPFHIKRIYSTNVPTDYSRTPTITGAVSQYVTADPADLEITKTMDNDAPEIGDNVVYTIVVENLDPSNTASGVVVTDQLPVGFDYVSDDSGGSYDEGTGVWDVGSLASGATATLEITAERQASGPYTNTASVSHNGTDSNPGNDSSSITPSNVCSGTHTIVSGSGGEITVNNGEVYCLYSGNWAGGVKINAGGTICIAEGATFNVNYVIGGGAVDGTIINRGTVTAFPTELVDNHVTIENYGDFTTNGLKNFAGTIRNYGTMTNTGGTAFSPGGSMLNNGDYSTTQISNLSGLLENNGTITNSGGTSFSPGADMINTDTYTSTTFQNFDGDLTNSGSFTISNNAAFLEGASITNNGDISINSADFDNVTVTNYDSFEVNNGFYFLGEDGYFENKSGATVILNPTSGSTEITSQFDNSGTAQIYRANSGGGISTVVNNYGTMQIYQNIIFGIDTYLTNDGTLEFHNATSVEFQGPLLQNNNLLTIFDNGNLSLNSSISQMVNNKKVVVDGTVSHNVGGSKIVNNCTILSENYQLVVGTTENNGLIWVNDEFKLEGDSFLINSATGFIRGDNFRNSGSISGYGSFYFTGETDFESAGSFEGDDPGSPIQFFDTTQTTDDIFDTYVEDNPAINVIRPDSMTPYDDSNYDCTAPPTTAGYPPQTEEIDIATCERETITFPITDYVQPHEDVEGNDFTLLFNSIRFFDPNDEGNGNNTSLTIAGKGTLSVNTSTGVITFTPNVAFTNGDTFEAEYRISNEWDGNPSVMPSSRTPITFSIHELPEIEEESGNNPVCIGDDLVLTNEVEGGEWTSDDQDVAVVDENGVVTGVSTGTTTIYYTATFPSFPEGEECELTVEYEVEVENCACYKNYNSELEPNPSKMGISTLKTHSSEWPENINNGFLVLESKNKGFVITRVEQESDIIHPEEGMLIYDESGGDDGNGCIKLFNGTDWNCIAKYCKP